MKSIVRRLIVGYARSAVKDDSSVKRQEKQIRKYCQKNYCYELDKMFIDNGCSGSNLNRPALKKLLVKVSKGDVCRVICLNRDRLARNITNYMMLMSLFKRHEVDVTFLEGVDVQPEVFEEIIACISAFEAQAHLKRQRQKKLGK